MQKFDVIVVGSGAAGGWACKRLSEAGLNVALVDCGKQQSDKNFGEHIPEFTWKYRNQAGNLMRSLYPVQSTNPGFNEFNKDWFCNDLLEPYTVADGTSFSWQARVRITGGRTNEWGRQSYRLSDLDFKAASHDGYGEDWPLSYKDVAPYYDIVEKYVGISGNNDHLPQLPDGQLQPPMNFTCVESRLRDRVRDRMGRPIIMGRTANLTRPINGRAACHYCGPCERGCVAHAYFNSYFTTVADALRTGKCTLFTNAMGYQVLMDPNTNRARGVLYIDRITREAKEVHARAVILAAQALESVRILLNSANRQNPNGLGNSSGVLGHYFMDHIMGGGAMGEFPDIPGKATVGGPNRPNGIYIPRFRNLPGQPRFSKFLRGFGYEGGGGPRFRREGPGFGESYKQAYKETRNVLYLGGFGECLARWDNYVEIDPNVKDTYGIPVLRMHCSYSDNEKAMVEDMAVSAAEMLEAAGAKNIHTWAHPSLPGAAIHEVGMARMGSNPKTSVLNQFQQTHDVDNLFVMDGAGFTSTACQNPTLTIMALCVRSCDHLLERMKRAEI